MSSSFRTFPWVVAVALCLGGRAEADFNMKGSVDGIQLGKHLLGPELKTEDLKNRVVLLAFWGVNCPPCLAQRVAACRRSRVSARALRAP